MITFHIAFCAAVVALALLLAGLFRVARFAVLAVKRRYPEIDRLAPDGSYYQ
jgi:hypothetical protein